MSDRRTSALLVESPLALHGGFRTSDLDEVQEVAAAAQHPLFIDLPGRSAPLLFELHHHPLSSIALTHAAFRHEGSLHVFAPPLESHYFLQVPLSGSGSVAHAGRAVRPAPGRFALLLSPGCETTMRGGGGFEEISLEIDAAAVDRAWELLTGVRPDAQVVFEPALRLDAEPGDTILRILRLLVDEASRPAYFPETTLAADRLEEALILCLLEHQPHSHDRWLRGRTPTTTASLVRRAEAWMEAHTASAITMLAVADAHGVTLRSLQRAFERHRSYSPRGFLRRVRLGLARTRLRRGAAGSVTQVAMEAGFRHLGRFSGDYRVRYGESPSATLRRASRSASRQTKPAGEAPVTSGCGFCPRGDPVVRSDVDDQKDRARARKTSFVSASFTMSDVSTVVPVQR